MLSCQASVAHRRHIVFPVPVGLSSSAFPPPCRLSRTFFMYSSWHSYASNGNWTSMPRSV